MVEEEQLLVEEGQGFEFRVPGYNKVPSFELRVSSSKFRDPALLVEK
jgi:hypothetical protein